MTEFVSLDEREQDLPIMPNHPHSISNITPDTKIIDGVIEDTEVDGICATYGVVEIDKVGGALVESEEVEHICIKDDCDVSRYYGCASGDHGFQKDNLFSELTDEYQRAIARINLGIADEYALKWGNIKGNLSNQKDLYTFVIDSIAFDINKVIDEINLKLAQWACEIEVRFKNKADIFSPNFTGLPTTTLPLISDNSNRIASTEWVNARIEAASVDDNIKSMLLDPEYMCYGDDPTDVKVMWEYYKDVEEQSINGVSLDPKIRQYTYHGMTTSMIITLKCKYGENTGSKVLTFDIKYPTFYGISPDYTQLSKTTDNAFTVDAGAKDYIYVLIPNGYNAVLSVNSIIGGFRLLGTQELFGNVYYIFKSANPGLGETTIEVVNLGNFDSNILDTTTIKELLTTKADKYDTYDKATIDRKLEAIQAGEINLSNYYTKAEVNKMIPDISGKADKSEIPTEISQLHDDIGYLTSIPAEYITEKELDAKGYLTEEVEPQFTASAAKTINQSDITRWNNKVDKVSGMGLSEQSFTVEEKAKLSGLFNYSDTQVRQLISDLETEVDKKANKSEIPDISGKADKSEIPVRTSQLENDSGFLTTLPGGLVTEEQLESKGYLTSFTETDPTVPAWAKEPNKPTYTLDELGAESKGSAAEALSNAYSYTDSQLGALTQGSDPNYNTFKGVGDKLNELDQDINNLDSTVEQVNTELASKANKSELFSGDYNDLTNLPTIPDISGLATEEYVNQKIEELPVVDLSGYALKTEIPDISGKVDKENGKGLSTNDFTNEDRDKLKGLTNYNDADIKSRIELLETRSVLIPNSLYITSNLVTYFGSFELALEYVNKILDAHIIILETDDISLVSYNKVIGVNALTIQFRYSIDRELIININYNVEEAVCMMDTAIITHVVNDTNSTNPSYSLSATQGKILMERIEALETLVNQLSAQSPILLEV